MARSAVAPSGELPLIAVMLRHKREIWLCAWTAIHAEDLGIFQRVPASRGLREINPFCYLVDVLQRISEHPASQVADLTPRIWKTKFSHDPMESDLALADQ